VESRHTECLRLLFEVIEMSPPQGALSHEGNGAK